MAAKSFLFDLDGTIWDSQTLYIKLIHKVTGEDKNQIAGYIREGQPIAVLFRDSGITKNKLRNQFKDRSLELSLYPGVRETLAALTRRRISLGIVTNLPQWIGEPMLSGVKLTNIFQTIHYYDISMRKNKAKAIVSAIEDMGLRTYHDIYYVGDTNQDLLAALEAGISFVWASFGYGTIDTAEDINTISYFKELLKL